MSFIFKIYPYFEGQNLKNIVLFFVLFNKFVLLSLFRNWKKWSNVQNFGQQICFCGAVHNVVHAGATLRHLAAWLHPDYLHTR